MSKARTKAVPAPSLYQDRWIQVVTRQIADSPAPGVPMLDEVMVDLCATYPQSEWTLCGTHFIGIEANVVSVMFIFTRKEAGIEKVFVDTMKEAAEKAA